MMRNVTRAGALFIDLYEIAMLRGYFELGMAERPATFSLFVRRLPPSRNFLLACGLADLLRDIAAFRYDDAQLRYLASLGFPHDFLNFLARLRFTGDIRAMPEGAPVFAEEPIVEVTAPIAQAQALETLIINRIGLQTMLASKAARVVAAARGRAVVDFGARRAQGFDAALDGARAFYIAGVAATSLLAAGRAHDIPVAGTMAHSFIEACASQSEAFRAYARLFPRTTLLVDTYDTIGGVRDVIALASEMGADFDIGAIRLDSGDLDALSRQARRLLDDAGLAHIRIVASGGLDEARIERLAAANAPIDMFGVGTDMSVSGDAPALDIAYKLVEFEGRGCMKLSPGKRSLPGRKQVFRGFHDGVAAFDVIAREGESSSGVALLREAMRAGEALEPSPSLEQIRTHAREAIATLPAGCRALSPSSYPVTISGALARYEREVMSKIAASSQPIAAMRVAASCR
ncbi:MULTISPECIES: nicotinate phosphoribosyltransferase [Methylosinus]|uniref:Nicotinate phosphoribosyltransferase n=1 Tax=Methylosinus trichosporium (strain ATCC 35070 / NCIMB 11131 / UNIQEM 75 / OB3b) TaxID=595536 RepID=A0A2D2D0K5_METT3|nr:MULTISPECIES: nicotinate phosphoribosyltransferase [Methylosinus]ATQ68528.1 nicotinate phosphoribosyltransferase [Methylosinus trichosporium OB3b]OBS53940.1 nicotinate phosphoribosyltransferase [Methylosinus sp. 3S-1]